MPLFSFRNSHIWNPDGAALDVILLGHIQTFTWSERLFLGLLAKSLFKVEQ